MPERIHFCFENVQPRLLPACRPPKTVRVGRSCVEHANGRGVVTGRRARRVKASEADGYIFGHTCVNEVTAGDLQRKEGQWSRAKGFDTFCPAGPFLVPGEEVDLERAVVRGLLNVVKKQDAPVRDMIFPVPILIEFITRFMTLEPGDLVAAGTPPGVGAMEPGSVVRVEIAGIGHIENPVVQEQECGFTHLKSGGSCRGWGKRRSPGTDHS